VIRPRVITADQAAALIPDGVTLATSGFVNIGFAHAIAERIEARFKESGHPKDLTLVHAAGQARIGHFAHAGMLNRVIAGYYGWSKEMQRLVLENEIEAYNWPQGVIVNMYRELAAGRKWHHSSVGVGTFVETDGGGLNAQSPSWWVTANGSGLKYENRTINVALIRATSYDTHGNLTMESERLTLETLHLAMAVRNSGGMVIAQVDSKQTFRANPYRVQIPGIFVDFIVEAAPLKAPSTFSRGTSDMVKAMIAVRASQEVRDGNIVNLGIGIPELIGVHLRDQNRLNDIVLTTESGTIGGIPAGEAAFGAAEYPDAVIDTNYQFDFYNGGGIDVAFLGFGEIDRRGNVNVSKFGGRLPGCGGFIDISQNAKRVIFVGKEMAGESSKIVDEVEHVTFNADHARKRCADVSYITDKGVYRLGSSGLERVE
jgi:propionate CoA-transferase